jgi:AAA+ ATPase superfamily predicted ATPase
MRIFDYVLFSLFIVSVLSLSEFYNRERELTAFRGIMRDSSLIAITGPRNTGKSWLIKKFLDDFPNKLHFDLRQLKFKDHYDFCDQLRNEFSNFFDTLKNGLKSKVGFSYFLTLELSPQREPTCDLQQVLIKIEQLLSEKSQVEDTTVFQTLAKLPVLWIDEANNLDQLRRTPEGTQMLQSLFDWFVRITKQNRNFIVILSSSDSFFLDWLAERMLPIITQ